MTADVRPPGGYAAGLCDACRHQRVIVSGKGSRFILCERSKTDPAYVRYPPLPVHRCAGFEGRVGERGP